MDATVISGHPRRPSSYDTVVFDLGGVLLSWVPELAYRQVMPADQVPKFLTRIDFAGWNRANDAGRPFDLAEQELIARFPDSAVAVRAYRAHFAQTLTGMVPGTAALVAELVEAGVRLLALTNWSAETFPHALSAFKILSRFEAIVVSGAERLAKPDPAIFELVLDRYSLEPGRTVLVDDSPVNVAAAASLGMAGLHFTDAAGLREQLDELDLLRERPSLTEPIFHITERGCWDEAQTTGEYVWSSRNLSYQQQGYVHCCFANQVEAVLARFYADIPRKELLLLELDPARLPGPIIVEDLDAGAAFPHLYAPLSVESVAAERALAVRWP